MVFCNLFSIAFSKSENNLKLLNNKQLEYCNLRVDLNISSFDQYHNCHLISVRIFKFLLNYVMVLVRPFREEDLKQDQIEYPICFNQKLNNYQLLWMLHQQNHQIELPKSLNCQDLLLNDHIKILKHHINLNDYCIQQHCLHQSI